MLIWIVTNRQKSLEIWAYLDNQSLYGGLHSTKQMPQKRLSYDLVVRALIPVFQF